MFWPVTVALVVTAPSAELTATAGKLSAPAARDRDAAGRTLLAAGPAAVPALTAAARSADPEARRRAVALLARIEADRLGAPTAVTLDLTDAAPAAAVEAVARQSGYRLTLSGPAAGPPVTLRHDKLPFWAAVDKVADAAGLTVNVQDDGRIALFPADAGDPFVSYAGPFRVAATGIHAGRHRQLAGLPRKRLPEAGPEPVHLSLTLAAEPKAAVVGVGQPTVFVADDDRGLSLKPAADSERTSYYPPAVGHRALVHGFAVNLQRRDAGGTVLAKLRGSVPVAVLADVSPLLAVPKPAAGATAAAAGASLTVRSAGHANGLFTVEVAVSRPDAPDGWQAGLAQRLELVGADGSPWPFAGVASQSGTADGLAVGVQFRPPTPAAEPGRLTLVEWRTVTREVGFEFAGVPLP